MRDPKYVDSFEQATSWMGQEPASARRGLIILVVRSRSHAMSYCPISRESDGDPSQSSWWQPVQLTIAGYHVLPPKDRMIDFDNTSTSRREKAISLDIVALSPCLSRVGREAKKRWHWQALDASPKKISSLGHFSQPSSPASINEKFCTLRGLRS
ncbi:hypothetical protein BDR07DRAFT_1401386 [Suillus spraguei]|nr:hypothetical protein BDR07DRAFT_1401386 [Suillus spraguei]